jgi:SAM-dependent methyltransferase
MSVDCRPRRCFTWNTGVVLAEPIQSRPRAICNYEGTSYRASFWDGHGREYEDLAERIALRRLLPPYGHRLLEVGAGFGRLADLYGGYQQVVLLDYARSGLLEARGRLEPSQGTNGRFIYVAADLYHLPLAPETCNTVVTVRVLHHLVDVPAALRSLAAVTRPGGAYVLEYANKRNLKAVARYLLRRQQWSPFAAEPYEFTELNFNFHPRWMARQLADAGFTVEEFLAVSHFRSPLLKRFIPAPTLATLDGHLQRVGAAWKLTPSVFARARGPVLSSRPAPSPAEPLFCCPTCRSLDLRPEPAALCCGGCGARWSVADGIYDFRAPAAENLQSGN